MNNKGEITTQQIVTMIILIASFAVILFFLGRLGLGETTESEICHNSVITRGSTVIPTDAVPLKCKREYVCLTSDNTCEQMTKPTKKKVESKEDVYEVLAEEMVDCWWMFGQGEVNYVGEELLPELYCSICSQVAFDKSIDFFENQQINEEEFYEYLGKNKVVEGEETYLEYLYGEEDITKIKNLLATQNVEFGLININNQQYIMMGITSQVSKWSWIGVGAVTAVSGAIVVALLPVGSGVALPALGMLVKASIGGAAIGTMGGFIREGLSGNDYLSPTIIEVNSEEYKALKCKSITTTA